jgi:hypothetical protein
VVVIENECVDCGLPCLYESCPYWAVKRYYCDKCGEEDELFYFEDREMCIDCIEQELDRVT